MPVKSGYVKIKQARKDILGDEHLDCIMYSNNAGQIIWLSEATVTLAEKQKSTMDESMKVNAYLEALQQGFVRGPQESDASIVYQKLAYCIQQNQLESFVKLLGSNYIYGAKSTEKDVYLVVSRCNIDALLNHEFSKFEQLVQQLLEKNDTAFYAVFQETLKLKIGKTAAQSLFLWDKQTQEKTTQKLEDIHKYGLLLGQKEPIEAKNKGDIACKIASQLSKKVTHRPPNQLQANDYKSQFENLKFKLEILRDLHAKDKLFATHRNWYKGWEHVVTNLCIFLLTLGSAHGINYYLTGNFLFFNHAKTATEKKILSTQEEMGFNEDQINFHLTNI